jgi:hypothetical protein
MQSDPFWRSVFDSSGLVQKGDGIFKTERRRVAIQKKTRKLRSRRKTLKRAISERQLDFFASASEPG